MTQIKILPHPESCPEGATLEVKPGKVLCDALLAAGVALEHACDGVCACSTCHVIIKEGYASLPAVTEAEEDQLATYHRVTPLQFKSCA